MLNITDKEARNILCTIIEGGSVYWMNDGYSVKPIRKTVGTLGADCPEYDGFVIDTKSEEKPKRFVIGLGDIKEAAERIIGETLTNSDIRSQLVEDRDGCDAWAADAVCQIAVFDELVYG